MKHGHMDKTMNMIMNKGGGGIQKRETRVGIHFLRETREKKRYCDVDVDVDVRRTKQLNDLMMEKRGKGDDDYYYKKKKGEEKN